MKNILLVAYLVCFVCGCASTKSNGLVGTWKSNEAKTLASMRSTEGITAKAKDVFENDFFGHLITEYREKDARVYFDREEDNVEGMKEYRPYTLLEETEMYFVIKYYDETEQKEIKKKLYREGSCYFMLTTKWEFREYFCKIIPNKGHTK